MFETWFRGGKEGNRIKILLCFTIYIYSSHIPKQVGPLLLIILREQPMNSYNANSGSERIRTIEEVGKRHLQVAY